MSSISQHSEPLSPQQTIAGIAPLSGVGSGIRADLVVTPRVGGSFGGYPRPTSDIAQPTADPSATYARFTFGA